MHIAPRNLVGAIGGRLIIGRRMLRQFRHVYRQTGAPVAASEQAVLPPVRKSRVNLHRLRVAAERLRSSGIHDALIERLVSHLINADDSQVLKMRAFALADAWGEPRMDVLRMCLYATRTGLLDLE